MHYLDGCTASLVLVHTLQWLILHGLNLILRSCGEYQLELGVCILLVILLGFRSVLYLFGVNTAFLPPPYA